MTDMPEREMAEQLLGGEIRIEKVLTMGVYQHYKWQEVLKREAIKGGPLTDGELRKTADSFSELNWENFREKSEQVLRAYRTTDEPKWMIPIFQGVISAFLYSLILVLALIIIQKNDIDLLHALGIGTKTKIERSKE